MEGLNVYYSIFHRKLCHSIRLQMLDDYYDYDDDINDNKLNTKLGDHLEESGIDSRTILKWISRDVDWIHVVQYRVQWWLLLTNIRFP
jgi:hypothetical protein